MTTTETATRPRLKIRYDTVVREQLRQSLGLANVMEVPRLDKIVLNVGAGRATQQRSLIEGALRDLEVIAGQKPVVTKAKRSISTFKIREGMSIGAKVTLRGQRMYDFLDRLVNVALPRVRDFRGISGKGFDGRGNFALGLKEQLIFPEIDYDKVEKIRGMDIVIVTSARSDEEAKELLRLLGMPFRD